MKKMTLLAVLVLSLVINVGKAQAFSAEKYGPVLHDPMPIEDLDSSRGLSKFNI